MINIISLKYFVSTGSYNNLDVRSNICTCSQFWYLWFTITNALNQLREICSFFTIIFSSFHFLLFSNFIICGWFWIFYSAYRTSLVKDTFLSILHYISVLFCSIFYFFFSNNFVFYSIPFSLCLLCLIFSNSFILKIF